MNSTLPEMIIEQAEKFCFSVLKLYNLLRREFISSITGEDLSASLCEDILDFIKKENMPKSAAENLSNQQVPAEIIIDEFNKLMNEKLQ